ncbi:MAG: TldD/PmbA family protein, partial [Lentisphaeraceae bacterium]|nr:TldD/PmbA family protein [Lentisphaeraceae bacterium]
MNITDALEYMYKCAEEAGSDQFDILAGESNDNSVQVYNGKVKETEISSSQGIGIRLFKDGKPGYSFTRKLSEEAIKCCVTDAADLSTYSSPVDYKLPEPSKLNEIDLELWNDDLQNLTTDQFLKLSFELENKAKTSHKLVENVLSAGVGKSSSSFYLYNSEGIKYNSKRNSVMAGVSLVAKKGQIKKTGGKYKSTRNFSEINSDELTERASTKAIELLDAKPIKAGSYPVLFDYYMAPTLLRSLLPALNAEAVQKGQSKFAGKVNSKIASSCLTMINDPFIVGLPGSGLIDSEGVATEKFNVIENGILKTFLYNLESAQKDGVKPTGT